MKQPESFETNRYALCEACQDSVIEDDLDFITIDNEGHGQWVCAKCFKEWAMSVD